MTTMAAFKGRTSFQTSMAANSREKKKRTTSKVKLEQYTERTLPYNDLVPIGLGPYDYRTIENPKYQKGFDNPEQV